MQEYLGVLIAAARRRLKAAVVSRAAGWSLTPQQFWILIALAEQAGASQSDVAERLRVDAPTISRSLAMLEERHLVRVEVDPGDRRRTRVSLTPAGARIAAELAPVAAEIRDTLIAGMTEPQISALREGLRRILSNLDRLEAGTQREQR